MYIEIIIAITLLITYVYFLWKINKFEEKKNIFVDKLEFGNVDEALDYMPRTFKGIRANSLYLKRKLSTYSMILREDDIMIDKIKKRLHENKIRMEEIEKYWL